MRKIILHCGMPKTGSSALQVQLSQSRDALLTVGLDYLQTGDFSLGVHGRISSGNGVDFAKSFLPPHHPASLAHQRAEQVKKVTKAINGTRKDIILSSEFFSAIPPHLMKELVATLSPFGQIILVFFVRDQLNFLASNYIQQVKRHGLTKFPDEFFATWNGYKRPITYYAYIKTLASTCPDVEIIAKPYELSRDYSSGLMGFFLDSIGAPIPETGLAPDLQVNLSPSPKEIRLMLEVNKHNPRMQFSDMLVESSHRAGRSKIHSQHSILSPAFAKEVREFFSEDNKKFFSELAKSENIYEGVGVQEEFCDLRQVTFDASDIVHILSGILVSIDKRLAALESSPGKNG